MTTLEQQISKKILRLLAGDIIYARGEHYHQTGAVTGLRLFNNSLIASVAGSAYDDYVIVLKPGKKILDWQCNCPMGEDGECCKHIVATGLAWLENSETLEDDTKLIKDYLLAQTQETLASMLLEQCVQDASLHDTLQQAAMHAKKSTRRRNH